jgi:hypothetical protein
MKFKTKVLILFATILFFTAYTKWIMAQGKRETSIGASNKNVMVIQSSKAGDRLTTKANLSFVNDDKSGLPVIEIN